MGTERTRQHYTPSHHDGCAAYINEDNEPGNGKELQVVPVHENTPRMDTHTIFKIDVKRPIMSIGKDIVLVIWTGNLIISPGHLAKLSTEHSPTAVLFRLSAAFSHLPWNSRHMDGPSPDRLIKNQSLQGLCNSTTASSWCPRWYLAGAHSEHPKFRAYPQGELQRSACHQLCNGISRCAGQLEKAAYCDNHVGDQHCSRHHLRPCRYRRVDGTWCERIWNKWENEEPRGKSANKRKRRSD